MSILSTHSTTPTTASRRANVLAEAITSAYIHEITPRRRPRARASFPNPCASSPRAVGRTPMIHRARPRARAPRRRAALELGA
ncbi:MAG TPA: hypothetical protein VGL51_11090 [Solirubrobacteraceae bacterium]|jgi:hypothetical protein